MRQGSREEDGSLTFDVKGSHFPFAIPLPWPLLRVASRLSACSGPGAAIISDWLSERGLWVAVCEVPCPNVLSWVSIERCGLPSCPSRESGPPIFSVSFVCVQAGPTRCKIRTSALLLKHEVGLRTQTPAVATCKPGFHAPLPVFSSLWIGGSVFG